MNDYLNAQAALLFARWRPIYTHPRFGRGYGRLVNTGISSRGFLTATYAHPFRDQFEVWGTKPRRDRFGRRAGVEPLFLASSRSAARHNR